MNTLHTIRFEPAVANDDRGLMLPIILLLVIVLLNVLLLAFALRLRRYFRKIADQAEEDRS